MTMRIRATLCLLVLCLTGASAPAADPGIVTSHGFAVFGALKYPAGFTHLDYTNADAPKGGVFRKAQPGTFDSLNIYSLLGVPVLQLYLTYDKLMERSLDEPASQYGVLAESITYPRDLAWVEFTLRREARWHDGTPITPEDVLFTLQQFKKTVGPAFRRVGDAVSSAVKTGPRSVRMILIQKNNRTLVSNVADMPVLPRHYYGTHDIARSSLAPPLANGAYRIGKFSAGRSLELVRVKDYWGANLPMRRGRMNFDTIHYDYYRDATVLNETFLAGNSDLQLELSATRWESEKNLPAWKRGDLKRIQIPYANGAFYQGLMINARRPLFRDARAREAMLLAYDYEWVQRVLLHGYHGRIGSFHENSEFAAHGAPTPGERTLLEPFRAQLPAALLTRPVPLPVGGDRRRLRANLIRAAALLREAGLKTRDMQLIDPATGAPARILIVLGNAAQERFVAQFVSNLGRLGIAADIKLADSAQMRERSRNFDFDLIYPTIRFPVLPVPGSEMRDYWSTRAADRGGSLNLSGSKNAAVDALLDTVATGSDRTLVVDAMRALDRVLMWNFYAIPVQHMFPSPIGQSPVSYWDKFGRPPAEPHYNWPSTTLDHWWVDPARDAAIRKRLGKRA